LRINSKIKLLEYYTCHPCVDCGESRPEVLELDHVRGVKARTFDGKRTIGVGEMITRNYTWKRIEQEIEKCEVRCANCHRLRTARIQSWYKGLLKSRQTGK
jgi:hypothetical protein